MAFWFLVIVVAYLLIFMVTGATDTITASVLALMGISAGTGLAAVGVDNSKCAQARAELDKLKAEYRFQYNFEAWKSMERDAIALSEPPKLIPPGEKPLPPSAGSFAAQLLSRAPEPGLPHNS